MISFARYGDYEPKPTPQDGKTRYSIEQLYALSLYLYALEPPNNPNGMTAEGRRGEAIFARQGCVGCHPAPLYTDHDFHNVGVGESERFRQPGNETGRFAHVPIGLKEPRLIGAFKTPTLRALPRTAPYFHDGSYPDLRSVVKYFNHSINGNRYLAQSLRLDAAGTPKALEMNADDQAALVLFLRALDGDAVDNVLRSDGTSANR